MPHPNQLQANIDDFLAYQDARARDAVLTPAPKKRRTRKAKPTLDTTLDTPAAETPLADTKAVDATLDRASWNPSQLCYAGRHEECPGCDCRCGVGPHRPGGR